MHDKFRKRYKVPPASARLRQQIALEAARRMFDTVASREADNLGGLNEASEADFYTAKRKAAAVLGHRVRPGDLPSDSEVRDQLLAIVRSREEGASESPEDEDQDEDGEPVVPRMGDVV